MWKGLATSDLYEEFLRNGLCTEHSKEFILASTNADMAELRTELQRQALLFIRLRIFDPIVFQKSCVSSKLMDLLAREDGVPRRQDEQLENFVEKVTLFDSVVVFIICYFSRICCIGALFLRKTKLELKSDDPMLGILQNVLEKKHLLESEINVLHPLLQRNFNKFDPDQIRLAYVATLLFVRNYIKRKTLKFVTDYLGAELKMSTECQELNVMGNEAFKKEQYEDAINLYSSALTKNQYSYIILSNRAQAFKKVGKYKEAQLDSYIAVTVNPSWCLGYCKLASSLFVQKLYDEAFIVATYGLSKCKNIQAREYETLESIKMEASFKKPLTETDPTEKSKQNSPKTNVPDNVTYEKGLEKKGTSENLENLSDYSTSNKEYEIQKSEKSGNASDFDASCKEDEIQVLKKLGNAADFDASYKEGEIQGLKKLANISDCSASNKELEIQISEKLGNTLHTFANELKSLKEFAKQSQENINFVKADDFQDYSKEKKKQENPPQNTNETTSESSDSLDNELKTDCSSKKNLLKVHLSPQKDVPPLLEAPESDDSSSEDETYFDSPSDQVHQKELVLDNNASQLEQENDFKQNVEQIREQISVLNESLDSKVSYVDSSLKSAPEIVPSDSEVGNQSSENHDKSCGTSDSVPCDIKMKIDKGTEGDELKVLKDTKEEKKIDIDFKKEEKKNVQEILGERKFDTKENNKKVDKKHKPMQAQNLNKKNSKSLKSISDSTAKDASEVNSILKDGSVVLGNGCGYLACRYFHEALSIIKESPEIYGFQECDIVCIKYAYAKAFYISGEYSDLQKCLEILQEITKEHKNISFPTVYYGLALAFSKLNRFKDSLNYSKMLQEILNKGIRFKVYPWPGLTVPIPETKSENLKKLVKDLIEECEKPPKPAAICRQENCSQAHIYYSDPDFRGFVCISCSAQCFLQYHTTCWKIMKTNLSLSDKDFLDKNCLTPDCSGTITQVKNIDKEGNDGKVFTTSESKKPQKIKKNKPEKKIDSKEEKKKRRRNSRCDSVSSASEAPSHEDLNPSTCSSKLSENGTENEISSSTLAEDLEISENAQISTVAISEALNTKTRKTIYTTVERNNLPTTSQISSSALSEDVNYRKTTESSSATNEVPVEIAEYSTKPGDEYSSQSNTLSADADPFYGEKGDAPTLTSKNAEILITKSKPLSKVNGKALKCNNSESHAKVDSYLQYSDAFWSVHEDEDFPPLSASQNSSHYAAESHTVDDMSIPPNPCLNEMIEKSIFTFMEDFLGFHGPLKTDDPVLIDALSEFPTEANILIADCGGISDFLKKNIRFAVVGEAYVCVVKDVVSAYNLYRSISVPEEADCHNLLNNICDFTNETSVNHANFATCLNPDATEYKPSFSPEIEYERGSKNNVNSEYHNSESIISVLNKLRQPLCVDEDNVIKNSNCDTKVYKLESQSSSSKISKTAQSSDVSKTCFEEEVISNCNDKKVIMMDINETTRDKVSSKTLESKNISVVTVEKENSHGIVGEISDGMKDEVFDGKMAAQSCEAKVQESVSGRMAADNSLETIGDNAIGKELVKVSDESEDTKNKMEDDCNELIKNKVLCKATTESEANSFQNLVDSKNLQKYAMKFPGTVSKASQTEKAQKAVMVSKETITTDESVDRMKEIIGLLQDKERNATKEIMDKTSENQKLLKEIKSLQKSFNTLNEEKKKTELILTSLKIENESMRNDVIEFRGKQEKCDKNLLEIEVKHQKLNEAFQSLSDSEKFLRTESQAKIEQLNALVLSLEREKLEGIKRAEKAELDVLHLKKAKGLDKINSKINEAYQKVNELKSGISIVPLDPVVSKSINALMSKIENQYVKDLCATRNEFEAKMNKHIKEVKQGTPLETLTIDEVKDLPEIPQLASQVIIPNAPFDSTAAWPTADPAYLNMASAFPSLAVPTAAAPLSVPVPIPPAGTANLIANVPIVPNVTKNIASVVPESTTTTSSASAVKKLPPGINSSFVPLPKTTCSSEPQELGQNVKSKVESIKSKPVSTESISSTSSNEGKGAIAAKFSDPSSLELGYSLRRNPNSKQASMQQGKNSYEKLLARLEEKFPEYTQVQLTSFIREFREKRQGKLSGLTLDAIVSQVGTLIQCKQNAAKANSSRVPEVITKSRPVQNKVSSKKLLFELKAKEQPAELPPVKKGNPWGNSNSDSSKKWSGDPLEECAICFDEFVKAPAYEVDCGHFFHQKCIQVWLKTKSDCPICRVHLLLPEDYPSLS